MKLFDIIKSRWPEAVMVAGLQACCMVLMLDFQHAQPETVSFGMSLLIGIMIAVFGIISQMLLLGFLYTAAAGGVQPVPTVELLRIGRMYFWRLMLFHLLLIPAMLLIFVVIQLAAHVLFQVTIEPQPPLWLGIMGETVAILILMKPVFFVPAVILLRDCGIVEAWLGLKEIRLSETGNFRIIAAVILIVGGAAGYLSGLVKPEDLFYYPALIFHALALTIGTQYIFLFAILETNRIISKTDKTGDTATG